jgi:hypothetical protein
MLNFTFPVVNSGYIPTEQPCFKTCEEGLIGEEVYKRVFRRVVRQCQKAGVVKRRKIIADTTLVVADASLNSILRREGRDPDSRESMNFKMRYNDLKSGKKKRKISNQTP